MTAGILLTNDRLIEKEIHANHRVRPALGERTGAHVEWAVYTMA